MAEPFPGSTPPRPEQKGIVASIRRRVRARILRPEDTRPLTLAGWLLDLAKVVALLVSLGLLVVLLTAGTPFLRSLSISFFGYRPTGALDNALVLAFFILALPVSFVAFTFCTVIVLTGFRSVNRIGSHLAIATPLVCAAFFPLYWYFLGPQLNQRQHLNRWPAQLELTYFNVCAVEVNEERSQTIAPVGRISLVLMNRSEVTITDAVFSVKAGSNWYHVSVTEIPARTKRQIDLERDLGVIEKELAANFSGWAQRSAEIYWDLVRPRAQIEAKLTRRPEIATVAPIGDCPRTDISGVWRGADGAELILSQRGVHPRGYLKGGGLEGTSITVSGTLDGNVFSGVFNQQASLHGTFTLSVTNDGRLQGAWTTESRDPGRRRSGRWNFARQGPGPAAERRR